MVSDLLRRDADGDDPEGAVLLGLGSGRTAEAFIAALGGLPEGERARLACVPTSEATWAAAEAAGIEVDDEFNHFPIALAVDGADEIGPDLSLVKGGGGALYRERIVAEYAQRFLVIADESKLVRAHGRYPLPVEVSPFCLGHTLAVIVGVLGDLGYALDPASDLSLRTVGGVGRRPVVTENGNHIVDLSLGRVRDPHELDGALSVIAGVVGHGLFLDLAGLALIGSADGRVRQIEAPSERFDLGPDDG